MKFISEKILLRAIFTGFILSFVITQTFFNAQCEDISENLLRLHILANSDSEDDQNLKLKVRDYILEQTDDMFKNVNNKIEAEHITKTNIYKILNKAQEYVYSLGYDYEIKGELKKNMYFSTREYDNFTLPAGNYDALRITIGEGKGHNWWCVMFPPMCFSMAEDNNENDLSDILSQEQLYITENQYKYEYKFKVVEIYNDIKNFFDEDK